MLVLFFIMITPPTLNKNPLHIFRKNKLKLIQIPIDLSIQYKTKYLFEILTRLTCGFFL